MIGLPVSAMAGPAGLPPQAAPAPGARAAVLQAAEAAARQSLGRPLSLGRPKRCAVQGRWAFVLAPLQGAHGGPFDYSRTPDAEAAAHGLLSRDYAVLLSASPAGWSVVATAVGPTDAAWTNWPATYGAPAGLFAPTR